MPTRKLTIVLIALSALWMSITSNAQDNLLQNGGFNNSGNYVDQRPAGSEQSFAIAPGWNGWQTNSPSTQSWQNIGPIAFPHTGDSKREGDASQNIGRGDATFTAAVYQTIGGVAEGNTYRFSAWVFQDSEAGSGSQTRVGIGSNVGGNPFGSPITWSPWMTSIDSWQEITVEATVPAGSITVFIYSTQSQPRAQNQNYYDDAELILVSGEGTVDVGDGEEDPENPDAPPPPPTSTPQTFAPFVSVQATQESGRITHTVVTGDTLAAIAVAYGVPSSEILELNGLTRDEARFLRIGQVLIISEGNPDAPSDEAESQEAEENEDTDEGSGGGFTSPTPQTVADAATDIPTPTDVPEEEATEELEPTEIPSATPIPATPTDAPTAPVVQATDSDPLSIETGVCTLMFDDSNNNNIQDADEDLLSGGQITLSDTTGDILQEYVTDGSEPFCFEELAPGSYTMRGIAPDGFGLNSSLRAVSVVAGEAFVVEYAAVEGLEVATIPTVTTSDADDPADIIEEEPDPINNIRNIAGILVLGIAGAVLLGGIVVGVLVGRN
ncbi:MAG: LysM peptidoglycan-binding domain-containing protein [Chloroflexota bacterium]